MVQLASCKISSKAEIPKLDPSVAITKDLDSVSPRGAKTIFSSPKEISVHTGKLFFIQNTLNSLGEASK